MEFKATTNLSDTKRKRLINSVVKDILVNYDQSKKLHHVRINFKLPVMRSVEEIVRANDVVLKRVSRLPNMAQTIENTGAPETVPSALFYSN